MQTATKQAGAKPASFFETPMARLKASLRRSIAKHQNPVEALYLRMAMACEQFNLPPGGRMLADDGEISTEVSDLVRLPFHYTAMQYNPYADEREAETAALVVMTVDLTKKLVMELRPYAHFGSEDSGRLFSDMVRLPTLEEGWIFLTTFSILKNGSHTLPTSFTIFHRRDVVIGHARQPKGMDRRTMAEELHRGNLEGIDLEEEASKGKGNFVTVRNGCRGCLFTEDIAHRMSFSDPAGVDLNNTHSMWTLLDFCLTLDCSNVETTVHSPSRSMNATRRAKGQLPYSELRVLSIGGEPIEELMREHQGGTHASPKFHRRRGHRRTLASGRTIWVKQHTVGRKENGSIQKVYDLAA